MAGREREREGGSPSREDSPDGFGSVPTPREIRESLRRAPKPDKPTEYRVEEAEFWRHKHLPPGSVLVYGKEGTEAQVAVLVQSVEETDSGLWVDVKVLGASEKEAKLEAQSYFKSGRRSIHICNLNSDGGCPDGEETGLHIEGFRWFPPGDFNEPWLSGHARKAVAGGKQMELEWQRKQAGELEPPGRKSGREKGGGSVEEKLRAMVRPSALRTARVRFAGSSGQPGSPGGDGTGRAPAGDGRPPRAGNSRSLVPYMNQGQKVKAEVIDLEESEGEKKKKPRALTLGESLAKAAKARTGPSKEGRKKKRSRSRSRSRRSRRKRRRRSDSRDGSSQSSKDSKSSSDESLMPPLQKKSDKTPGAVFEMLEKYAAERLSQDTALEGLDNTSELSTSGRPRFHTYYQLCLKPQLDPRSRDCKELNLLARALDLLRSGRLERLADVLSARLMAVETATKQGWQTARYLEIDNEAEEGSAPPHVLLAAQRHGRMVEKAGGKGSWPRSSWSGYDWGGEPKGKGKGKDAKGKGKKGKAKGRGGKGQWNSWTGDRAKGGEGTTPKEGEK